jgi:hypothetical protein
MADEHDSWFKPFGFDPAKAAAEALQKVKAAGAAVVEDVKAFGQKVETAVVDGAKKVANAVPGGGPKPAPKPAAPSDGGSSSSGGGSVLSLTGSVGAGGKNNPDDVKAVQRALGISDDGKCGGGTINAIKAFQTTLGHKNPDGRVDVGGGTAKALAGKAGGGGGGSGGGAGGGGAGGDAGGGSSPAPAPAPDPSPAPAPEDEGFLADLKKKVVGKLESAAGAVKELGGKVLKGAEDLAGGAKKALGGNLGGSGGGKPALADFDLKSLVGTRFHVQFPDIETPLKFPKTSKLRGGIKFKIDITLELVSKDGSPLKAGLTTNMGIKIDAELARRKSIEITESLSIVDIKETLSTEGSAKKFDVSIGWSGKLASTKFPWVTGPFGGKIAIAGVEWEKIEKNPDDYTLTQFVVEGGIAGEGVVPLDAGGDANLKEFGLKITVRGLVSGSIGPNWPVIGADLGKKLVENVLTDAAMQGLLEGGLIAVAIGSLVGMGVELAKAGEERELVGQVAGAKNRFERGMFDVMQGKEPSGDWETFGGKAGTKVFRDVKDRARKQHPGADEEEIRRLALNACATVSKNAEVQPKIALVVGTAFWQSWIQAHKGVTTFLGDAKRACGICFGGGPVASNDPRLEDWKKVSVWG